MSEESATRKAVMGWHAIMDKKAGKKPVVKPIQESVPTENKQQAKRKLIEQQQLVEDAAIEDENVLRKLSKNYKQIKQNEKSKLNESAARKTFKGTSEQCMLKMIDITEKMGNIHKVEQIGFNLYSVIFTV